MQFHPTRSSAGAVLRRTPRGDRIIQGIIVGSGVAVLLLLAWVHLGLGALLFPPSVSPAQMAANAGGLGGYRVTLSARSGSFVTGDANVVSFQVRDASGQPVTDATVRVHADMTTMAMPVPDVSATASGAGSYGAHLLFSMAGTWRLAVTIQVPGHAPAQATFDVGVRWR